MYTIGEMHSAQAYLTRCGSQSINQSVRQAVRQSVSVLNNILSVSWREQVTFDEMMVMSALLKTNTPSAN